MGGVSYKDEFLAYARKTEWAGWISCGFAKSVLSISEESPLFKKISPGPGAGFFDFRKMLSDTFGIDISNIAVTDSRQYKDCKPGAPATLTVTVDSYVEQLRAGGITIKNPDPKLEIWDLRYYNPTLPHDAIVRMNRERINRAFNIA